MGAAFRNDEVVRWPLLQAPTAPIDPRDVAAVAAHVLTDAKTSHAGKSYVITGPESLTQREQLQIIADTVGRPLPCEDLAADEARRVLADTFPLPALDMLLDAWTAALGQPAYVTTTVTDLLGRPATSAIGPGTMPRRSTRRPREMPGGDAGNHRPSEAGGRIGAL